MVVVASHGERAIARLESGECGTHGVDLNKVG